MNQDTVSPLAEDMLREAAELSKQRPIFCAIAERLGELARQKSSLAEQSAEWKRLDKRSRKLWPYLGELPCYKSKQDQERMVSTFVQSLQEGTIGRKGQPINNWNEIRLLTDGFQEAVRKRPRGHPPDYRHRITEALELKLQHSDWTWSRIAQHLELDIPRNHLMRQITMLRKLLREESVFGS